MGPRDTKIDFSRDTHVDMFHVLCPAREYQDLRVHPPSPWWRHIREFLDVVNMKEIWRNMWKIWRNILDLKLKFFKHLDKLKIDFDIYRKPTYTGISIHNDSLHPIQHKVAIINSAIHRLVHLPLRSNAVNQEINTIKKISRINGLVLDIDKMVQRKRLRLLLSKPPDPVASSPPKRSPYVRVPYLGPSFNKLASELRRLGYRPAFYPVCTLARLSSLKDPFTPLQKSGICKAVYEDCSASYYGQTGRNLRKRITEHLNEYKKARRKAHGTSDQIACSESAIADHSLHIRLKISSSSLFTPRSRGGVCTDWRKLTL